MDESFSSDLAAWLSATSERYVVSSTLKDANDELTQVVYRRDADGNASVGPFVRKRFAQDTGRGHAYQQILQAQTRGVRLSHQPLIYECERSGDFLEVVMEFVPGRTLSELVADRGPSIALAQQVFPLLCNAVSELHTSFDQPIIHRDVKPSNVMVDEDRLVLIDLGIARTYHAEATRDTVRYGTPGYAPPEQFGYGQTSVLSDVYALGMTLAFCLTGEDPTAELRERKFADPCIPPKLAEVLTRATQFDPERRHQSALALRDDFLHALPTQAQARQPRQRTSSTDGRMPVSATKGIRSTWRQSKALEILGRIWNVVVLFFWCIMMISCVLAFMRPNEETAKYPAWFAVMEYVGLLIIPWTALSYLLLDKRRLRKHDPFSRFSWRVELPVCLIVGIVSMIVVVAIYNLAIKPAGS